MKRLILKIAKWVKKILKKLDKASKKLIPIAINVVQAIKKIMDSPVDDVIKYICKFVIPGDADDKLYQKLKDILEEWIPKILLQLNMVESINNIEDTKLYQKLKDILEEWIPKILLQLNMVESINNIEDTNEKLKAILAELNLKDKETKFIFLHGLASVLANKFTNNKITLGDSALLAEATYRELKS